MARSPNKLPQTKADYIAEVCRWRSGMALDYALFLYHAEVPADEAKAYLETYMLKLGGGGSRTRH